MAGNGALVKVFHNMVANYFIGTGLSIDIGNNQGAAAFAVEVVEVINSTDDSHFIIFELVCVDFHGVFDLVVNIAFHVFAPADSEVTLVVVCGNYRLEGIEFRLDALVSPE